MDKKRLFTFGKEYLLMRTELSDEILNHYLNLWEIRKPISFNELCRNMIDHAQNRRNMPKSIGDIENLKQILCEFNPTQIKNKYKSWVDLFKTIKKNPNYIPPGPMNIDNSHNYWVIFCKSIISIATYLDRFGSFDNFKSYVSPFLSDNPEIRLAFPLILKEEIFGYSFALACDFTKENISPEFIKPDRHIRDIFVGVGICEKEDNDYNIFRKVLSYSQEINEKPYAVDRLFWLIGSGKLFKTSTRQTEVTFRRKKSEFIEEFNKIR